MLFTVAPIFQSLIGLILTRKGFSDISDNLSFQSLIGLILTYDAIQKAIENIDFNPL